MVPNASTQVIPTGNLFVALLEYRASSFHICNQMTVRVYTTFVL